MNHVTHKVDKVTVKDDEKKDNKEHRPTLRNKSVKKKKMTDDEILTALSTSITIGIHVITTPTSVTLFTSSPCPRHHHAHVRHLVHVATYT